MTGDTRVLGPLDEQPRLKARAIAYYLPQFHPIPENDEWWGPGFTEWTNVAKAKPLFPGHYQPHLPGDLGFYDLRVPEVRQAQAEMAWHYGIEGFCYYHYWFAGKRLLERPFNEVLESGSPDFPFCLCWANESWSGIWHGCPDRILMEQTYPGPKDDEAHFYALLEAFRDQRYIKVEGKPLFLVYKPRSLPDALATTQLWRRLAKEAGLEGLFLVGLEKVVLENSLWVPAESGFDGVTVYNLSKGARLSWSRITRRPSRLHRRLRGFPRKTYPYEEVVRHSLVPEAAGTNVYPTVIPNWDNTPRCGHRGLVFHGSTPVLFAGHLRSALAQIQHKPWDHRILFVKSWNEWAEGNHLEPDLRFGRGYLEAFLREMGS